MCRSSLVHVPDALKRAPGVSGEIAGSRIPPPVCVDDHAVRERRNLYPDERFARRVPSVDFVRKDDSVCCRERQVGTAGEEVAVAKP